MSLNSHFRSLIDAVEQYELLLRDVSEDIFTRKPKSGGWSYSETFSHIFQSNLASLIAIEKCFLGTGILNDQRTNWKVWAILFFGKLPPGKFKAPERLAAMVNTLSKEDASNLIMKFRNRLTELKSKVEKANRYQKIKHPRLGLLNARQWMRFIEIHTWHHTRQLKRIGKEIEN